MRGRFVGTDGSMGFRNGKIYDINTTIQPIKVKGVNKQCIVVMDRSSAAWCPYESLEAVMKNWEFNLIHTKHNII